ncbi:uncharacterized protein FFB20_00195 [Fusarium fujikuroi]|uniref:Uncharacterized protein n=2 Tax=Fusarium fujikuroi TaxID=5127 RepID=S0E044_GIBF5|nr:uncharacterized protein FFUJ_07005 [Fusarium fujikuroi IMI 58289]SCN63978.1 uncharacterized protein FFB20_00195 [Fusarium fujikuroi]CCT68234.1 uncharacterized protein FFUJ_07005 [Fusarium fujikuroi IMI 58289]SCN77120.1 uncharacterized protein FFC1_02538 [Fusarium fujikuroi]SCN87001.1 uncharacterized protein FFE2_06170 [Fusarium fujikuroi]SCN93246.1 uncharacterized protein FFM5_05617 [Fusarium fujikuroi]
MRKPSVQQPWKAHVPTVSEIEGPVAVGLIDVKVVLVVLVVVEEALEIVELLVVEVLELVVVVELARDVVLEVDDVDEVDELVVEDVVEEDTPEVERDVAVAEMALDMDDTPAGPPATKELNEETAEAPDDIVRDEGRLTMEDVVTENSALREEALETLEIDEVVLVVVVVETRELVEESVAKVIHVVEEVLELALEVVVDEVEVVDLEEELVLLLLAVEEALVAAPLVEELKTELLEPPETERLVAILVEPEIPEEDVATKLEAEEDALLRPPAKLPNTLSEVLKELVELVDILLENGAEIELLTEPVLVEAPFEVELDSLLEEELPLGEAKEDGREALEELDVAPMLVDATEPELDTERAALEEAAIEEPTPLADEKAPIDVGNELL